MVRTCTTIGEVYTVASCIWDDQLRVRIPPRPVLHKTLLKQYWDIIYIYIYKYNMTAE